jgi:hypothetical protein
MAMFCQADLEFLGPNDDLRFAVDGRWSSTGEPRTPVGANRVFDFTKVPALRFDHITPGRSANIALAIKHEGEAECYGFGNLSYADARLSRPVWRVDQASIKVRVTVVAGNGERVRKTFVIDNPDLTLDAFTLSAGDS